MRHKIAFKQLSRSTSHRLALRRNMAQSLFEHGAIRTTVVKAKELRSFVEKLITLAKRQTLAARRQILAELNDRRMVDEKGDFQENTVVAKLFKEIGPKYATRNGGYTRIIRLSDRRIGDAGKTALLQLVEETTVTTEGAPAGESRRQKRAAKMQAAASIEGAPAKAAEEPKAE